MKNQRSTHVNCLVAANLLEESRSCLDTDRSDQSQISVYRDVDRSNPTNEIKKCKANNHHLPSGYYDALENPISEEEY